MLLIGLRKATASQPYPSMSSGVCPKCKLPLVPVTMFVGAGGGLGKPQGRRLVCKKCGYQEPISIIRGGS